MGAENKTMTRNKGGKVFTVFLFIQCTFKSNLTTEKSNEVKRLELARVQVVGSRLYTYTLLTKSK